MSSTKFTRKNDLVQQKLTLKCKYDLVIRTAFHLINDKNQTEEEKLEHLKSDYYRVADRNIEKNEFFYERLQKLKLELQDRPNKKIISYYYRALDLFFSARLLSKHEFDELYSIQKKDEVMSQQMTTPIKEVVMPSPFNFEDVLIHKKINIQTKLLEYLRKEAETQETLQIKKQALEFINEVSQKINFAKSKYPDCQVGFELYGSFVNGFSIKGSDIDVSININTEQQCDEKEILNFFSQEFKKIYKNRKDIKVEKISESRVPIVEITLEELENITVSFSINNKLGVINSKMLKTYTLLDNRCQMLGILVKLWAKAQNVISAKNSFLSSYAYNLMVINFLQTIKNPILPSLQKIRENDKTVEPKHYSILKNIKKNQPPTEDQTATVRIDYENDVSKVISWMEKEGLQKNSRSVIRLLKDFFKFYKNTKNVQGIKLSVKEGAHIKRDGSQDPKDKFCLYSIEDPFDLFHNPGKSLSGGASKHDQKVLDAMEKSYQLLKEGKVMEIFQT